VLSDSVAEQVTRWRKHRGWSREQLADRCKELGMPDLTPAAITNVESGRKQQGVRRRHITVDELLVLATALKVPAFLLITPVGNDVDVEIIPGVGADPWDAYTICAGTGGQVDTDFRSKLATYARHDDMARRWMISRKAELTNPWLETVVSARAEMRANGWRLPRLPPAGYNTPERGQELVEAVELVEMERGVVTPSEGSVTPSTQD
jgi:transcriptional regulator with XRE-family HTH domain